MKSLSAKILTVTGMYDVLDRPMEFNGLSPIRMIIGGAVETPKVEKAATPLYLRLLLLAQFFRNIFGWEMPVSWVQSINPVFIILLSGVFAAVWTKWGPKQPSTPIKFAAGTVIMGLAFLLFLPFAGGGANSTPLLAMIGILFVFTVAELLISPVGLSVATKLAPSVFKTQMVALFFLSIALGTAVSGRLAEWYTTVPETLYFGVLGGIAIVLGVILAVIARPVLKLMGGVK